MMKPVAVVLVSLCVLQVAEAIRVAPGEGVSDNLEKDLKDFQNQYYNIFKTGNRNAASHLWSSYLLDRSSEMTHEKLTYLFTGFCAVSGSIVDPSHQTRYRVTMNKIGGGNTTGFMFHCCWPCTCDAKDFIRVDTKTITLAGGEKRQYHFTVIGNPCEHAEYLDKPFAEHGAETTLREQAPELQCDQNGHLKGAHMSDNGYIILSMLHDDDKKLEAMEEPKFEGHCSARAAQGYQSGMGAIFRQVASISALNISALEASYESSAPMQAAFPAISVAILLAVQLWQ